MVRGEVLAGAALGVGAAVVVASPLLVVVPALNVLGFSAAGPVAGSLAAGWMGPATTAGSWYAWAQSTAMATQALGATGYAATGLSGALGAFLGRHKAKAADSDGAEDGSEDGDAHNDDAGDEGDDKLK